MKDVTLPRWAKSIPDFIAKMRTALESNYVSSQLHYWIDLIFGYKQQGEEAFYSLNLFNPLSYENGVNFDEFASQLEIDSLEELLTQFG